MPSATFRPTGAAAAEPYTSGDLSPVIVGGGYVGDDDDTTYVDASITQIDPTHTQGSSYKWALGANPYSALPADKSTLTSVVMALRVKAEVIELDTPQLVRCGLAVDVRHNSATEYDWSAFDTLPLPGVTSNAWYDLDGGGTNGLPDLTDLPSVDWSEVTSASDYELVLTPLTARGPTFASGTMTVRVYEVALDIIWDVGGGFVTSAPVSTPQPLRIHPRDDGLGTSPGRIWPPPTSRQFSHRPIGYI